MKKENWEEEFEDVSFDWFKFSSRMLLWRTPHLQVEKIKKEIKSFIRQLLRQEREKQYDKVVRVLEKILGYCGIWNEDDTISVERKTGHGVSMTVKTFLELLKEEMVENKKGRQK
jgi:hypothetical protein